MYFVSSCQKVIFSIPPYFHDIDSKNGFHKILIFYGIDCFIPFTLNPHSGYTGKIVNLKITVVPLQYYLATFLDFCDTCASKSLKQECRTVHITRNKVILKTYDF